ncbi:hypothetical protein [Hoeflea prorocentri]|uniref:Uncharacterized protein n=1 Tax=Hoeflea prorocentri TaxID=1922333 RepID=A0A9X3ZHL6_9HYPH|nr:hypothetical protein [Hoeflea prorocentri]MCY6381972.1 hypothetical protein [Hoeflea prorocentri]MDA5399772.1 hypothetical protein [Hoeflea prorocentri]
MQLAGLEGVGAGLAALGFWFFIAAVIIAGIWYDIAKRRTQHETLRRIVESGQAIDEDVLDKVLASTTGGGARLERELMVYGLISLFVAPGIAVLAWLVSLQYAPAFYPILGAAFLVGFAAFGLIASARYVARRDGQGDDTRSGRLGR